QAPQNCARHSKMPYNFAKRKSGRRSSTRSLPDHALQQSARENDTLAVLAEKIFFFPQRKLAADGFLRSADHFDEFHFGQFGKFSAEFLIQAAKKRNQAARHIQLLMLEKAAIGFLQIARDQADQVMREFLIRREKMQHGPRRHEKRARIFLGLRGSAISLA